MISSINPTTFKAIYQNPKVTFSQEQKQIADDIVLNIKTPDKKGISLEKHFEKMNWDFYLDSEKNDTVSLSLLKGPNIDSSDRLHIGTYNKNHKFAAKDVNSYSNKLIDFLKYIGLAMLLIAGALGFAKLKDCSNINPQQFLQKIQITKKI